MRLAAVEVRRILLRRLTWGLLLAGLIMSGLAAYSSYDMSRPPSAQEQAQMQESYQQAMADWKANGAQQVTECKAEQERQRALDPAADLGCNRITEPKLSDFRRPQMHVLGAVRDTLTNNATFSAFLALLIGISAIAAEFTTGSLANWLTFEPRRSRVFASKATAAALAGAALVALIGATAGLLTYLAVRLADATAPLGDLTAQDVIWVWVRVVALGAVAGLAGHALGTLLRHTAAALAVVIGYLIVVEGFILQGMLRDHGNWSLTLYLQGWVAGSAPWFTEKCGTQSQGNYSCTQIQHEVGMWHSGIVLGCVALALTVLAWAVFRRRDLTN